MNSNQNSAPVLTMPTGFRKFMLTAHITFSVGWLGAVTGFLALNIAALNSRDMQIIRGAYIAMDLIGWYIILPASILALVTGIIQSLGTKWGLLKHYWVLIKLLLTIGSTILLLLHMQPISYVAELASTSPLPDSELRNNGSKLLTKAIAALLVLFVTTIISVYKPWGKTGYGQDKNKEAYTSESKTSKPWGRYIIIAIICFVLFIIIKHLLSGGMHHH